MIDLRSIDSQRWTGSPVLNDAVDTAYIQSGWIIIGIIALFAWVLI